MDCGVWRHGYFRNNNVATILQWLWHTGFDLFTVWMDVFGWRDRQGYMAVMALFTYPIIGS